MTTDLKIRAGDRVRHSAIFMRAFRAQWSAEPGSFEYDYIAQAEGRVMCDVGNDQYMIAWQHAEDLDENERQLIWHRSDFDQM